MVAGVTTLYSQHAFAEACSRQLEMIAPHLAVAVTSVANARTGMGLPALGRFTKVSERALVAARLP